ncbi:Importin alpha subunit (Karyopherin alpha subunit) (Serine-rich RNA polymerase I suppressor protein) [Tulasnella sp. 427]|nr:Importin alpha subunit (Karyopherin alpha subunit) (Serine-rich RNA polymerase I suppressor protein) [Tulasnella sp. 427]
MQPAELAVTAEFEEASNLEIQDNLSNDTVPDDFQYDPTFTELYEVVGENGKVIPQVTDDLVSESYVLRLKALIRIQRRLQGDLVRPTAQAIVDSDLVQTLVDFMTYKDIRFQERAASVTANIASGPTEQAEAVVAAGAVRKIMDLHPFSSSTLAHGALYALGNIAADSGNLRDVILACDGVLPLMKILTHLEDGGYSESRVALAVQTLATQDLIPILAQLIRTRQSASSADSLETLENSVIALSRICDKGFFPEVSNTGILRQLVELCGPSHPTVQRYSLLTLGYFVADTEPHTDAAIEAGVIPALMDCITASSKHARELACWTASNIIAGTLRQAQAILDAGIIKPVVARLSDRSEEMIVKKEACWVLTNLVEACFRHRTKDWTDLLYEERLVTVFGHALTISDGKIQSNAAQSLRSILDYTKRTLEKGEPSTEELIRKRLLLEPEELVMLGRQLRTIRDTQPTRGTATGNCAGQILKDFFPAFSRRARV